MLSLVVLRPRIFSLLLLPNALKDVVYYGCFGFIETYVEAADLFFVSCMSASCVSEAALSPMSARMALSTGGCIYL